MELPLCVFFLEEFHGFCTCFSSVCLWLSLMVDWHPHPQHPKFLNPLGELQGPSLETSGSSRVPHGPATASENWSEMHIPGSHSRPTELETPGVGLSIPYFNKPLEWFWRMLGFENHWEPLSWIPKVYFLHRIALPLRRQHQRAPSLCSLEGNWTSFLSGWLFQWGCGKETGRWVGCFGKILIHRTLPHITKDFI